MFLCFPSRFDFSLCFASIFYVENFFTWQIVIWRKITVEKNGQSIAILTKSDKDEKNWCKIAVTIVGELAPPGFQRKIHQRKVWKGLLTEIVIFVLSSRNLGLLGGIWLYLPPPDWLMHAEIIWLALRKCSRKHRKCI